MLGLQAKAGSISETLAALSKDRAIQKIAAVELNARFGRQDLQYASAGGFENLRGQLRVVAIAAFQNPIVIVTASEFELFVFLLDARADGGELGEIERSTADRAQFSGRNDCGIDGRKILGMQEQLVVQNFLGRHAG